MNLSHPGQRLAGLAIVLVCLALYEPGASGWVQRLAYPLVLAAGAWALVQNVTAVALAGTVLAVIHTDLSANDWVARYAYPALALIGAAVLIWNGARRFRRRIAETHDARWSDRRSP